MSTQLELKTNPAPVGTEKPLSLQGRSPFAPEKVLRSSAVVAFVLFLMVNALSLLVEPGAYYVDARKGLNMPEKVGIYLMRKPVPDVLFMGSSRPCLGFDTEVAQAVLDREKSAHTIMNMSVVATAFDFNNILLKNWVLPHHPPKVIVYGCSEFDLFGTEVGKNRYRSLWRNMPYEHTLSRWDDWQEYVGADLTDQIEFGLDQVFPLIRDRKVFRDALTILCRLYPVALERRPKDFLSRPAHEFSEKEVFEADYNYRNYLPHYDTTKPYLADMERFISMAKARNIQLIFVNMPVTKRFRDYWKDGGVKIEQYRTLLKDIATKHGITYRDYYDAPEHIFDSKSAFRDTNHLSKHGAKTITELVVRDTVVPMFKRLDAQSASQGKQH